VCVVAAVDWKQFTLSEIVRAIVYKFTNIKKKINCYI
jgi:hypothetical protein